MVVDLSKDFTESKDVSVDAPIPKPVLENEVVGSVFKPVPESEWISASQFEAIISRLFDTSSDEFQMLPFQGREDLEFEDLMFNAYAPKKKITAEENVSAKVKLRDKMKKMKSARTRLNMKNGIQNMVDR